MLKSIQKNSVVQKCKNARKNLDEKAKCQPWNIKIRMKKQTSDENGNGVGLKIFYIQNG